MLGLPKTTEFNKRIPKEKFYENLNVTPSVKKSFVEQIKVIYWRNKIAPSTINLAGGGMVTEIEVFEVKLKSNTLDENVLKQIDKEISYHIVFVLEYGGKYQIWTAYKEANNANNANTAFKVNQYFHTEWLDEVETVLKIDGLSMDVVYENFVRQIAGDRLEARSSESLKDSVAREERIQQLNKQIDILQAKIRKEKQLNVQIKLNTEVKRLKDELQKL